jgi:Predicted aminoglycoside phosphotransferase
VKEDFQNITASISPRAKLISAEILPGGYSSDVYILSFIENRVKKKVVLRSEGSPRSENRISTEYNLINCLKDSNLPLPEAIHIDVSLKYFPKPFMVMSFIDGKSFER